MKKLITISTTLLLLISCLAGCGQKEKEEVEIPENYLYTEIGLEGEIRYVTAPPTEPPVTMGETTEPQPVVIDAFDTVTYEINQENALDFYPSDLYVAFRAAEESVANDLFYEVKWLSATLDTITVELALRENAVEAYLTENNYVVEETSKIFEIKTSEVETFLLNADMLTEDVKSALLEGMKQQLAKEIKYGNDLNEGLSDQAVLEKFYTALPKSDVDYVAETSFNSYSYGSASTGQLCTGGFDGTHDADQYRLYALFQTEGGYYLAYARPVLKDGIVNTERTEYGVLEYRVPDSWNTDLVFPSADAAYAEIQTHIQSRAEEDNIILEELPLS